MDENDFLQPIDQLFFINKALIENADKIIEPIITVGGQAVHYWVVHYLSFYRAPPESVYITSNDVDFSTRRSNLSAIETILNVEANVDENGPPPSLALILLKDKVTHKIKSEHGKYYVNHELYDGAHEIKPNIVDVIDFPAGFEHTDFKEKSLLLNTEPFQLPIELETPPNDLIRILNPISCVRSRIANIDQKIKHNITAEVERIKSLRVPVVVFILDKFLQVDFRDAKEYLYKLFELLQNKITIRTIAKHNIDFHSVLDALYESLKGLDGIEEEFLSKDFVRRAEYTKKKIDKKIKIYAELEAQHSLT
ncbi:TPA: hypothetical protein RQN58_002118 [Aeromonas dhakensis]|nr:hypothetical protein [Aeromonas dhakensis]